MKWSLILSSAAALAIALPAAAQERGVNRRQFAFLDNEVTVEVMTDIPGTLQIVRGEPGLLDVAGRVPGGISSFALGGRDGSTLRLSAIGGEHVDFMVVVPEDAYLRVRLPNRKFGDIGSTRPGGTFKWDGKERTYEETRKREDARPMPMPAQPAYSAASAPRALVIPRLTAVRTVSVRLGGSMFEVTGDHIVSATYTGPSVDVVTGDQADDIVVNVPAGTRDFTVKLGGRTALVVRGPEITSYCEPVTEQILDSTRRWFTFAPEAGLLSCR